MELLSAVHLGWHSSVTGTALGPQSGQCPLWDGGTEDVEVPHTLQLRLWVLNQTTIPARGQGGEIVVLFFPPLLEAKITGPGEGQLETTPMAKSNYQLYP